MRVNYGWLFREPAHGATPGRIKVSLKANDGKKKEKTFDDSSVGAEQAAAFVSENIGDSWKLEDLAFLGYRIMVET